MEITTTNEHCCECEWPLSDSIESICNHSLSSIKEKLLIKVYAGEFLDLTDEYSTKLLSYCKENNIKVYIKIEDNSESEYEVFNTFINFTKELKNLSKCTRLKVGAIIVKNNRIISTGVNGTPKGFKNCADVFTKDKLLKPEKYLKEHHDFSEKYEIHAEMNAVIELAKNTSIDGYGDLSIFCSTCPCSNCAKLIAGLGIKTVYFHDYYDRSPDGYQSLQKFGIATIKI